MKNDNQPANKIDKHPLLCVIVMTGLILVHGGGFLFTWEIA